MIDELTKYKENDHFFITENVEVTDVCNAPSDKSGVYIVYALKNGRIELVYIGRSGRVESDGSMFIRKTGLGGIKDRIVNGHHFSKEPGRISWKEQMRNENIEGLDVYWFATHGSTYCDCPRLLKLDLLRKHVDIYGQLPRWNMEI